MADDPFRLRVMKAVGDCLKGITAADGYKHDMDDGTDSAGRVQERVFRGRTIYGDNDPLPMLSVLEDPKTSVTLNGSAGSAVAANEFSIYVMGFVEDDKTHPLDPAYHLSADVITALVRAKKDQRNILGIGNRAPCVLKLTIGQPIHRPPDDEVSVVAYFLLPVTLTLVENLEDPFA